MTISASQDPVYLLWLLLRRGAHVTSKARNAELRKFGISAIEAAVLAIVHDMDNEATATGVSRHLFREPHSVSELMKRMTRKRLLKKLDRIDKRNVVRYALTEKGVEAYNQSMKLESIRHIMSSFSEQELQQMRSSLLKILKNAVMELAIRGKMPIPTL